MVVEWLVIGFVVALPLFTYIGALALLNRMLRKEGPKLVAVQLSSKQATQCQATIDKSA